MGSYNAKCCYAGYVLGLDSYPLAFWEFVPFVGGSRVLWAVDSELVAAGHDSSQ